MEQLARVQLRALPAVGIDLAAMSDAYPGNGSCSPVSKPPKKEFQRLNIQISDNDHESCVGDMPISPRKREGSFHLVNF